MYALTSTGTTVKSLQKDDKSVTFGNSLGIIKPPLKNFVTTIPAVMRRKTTARASDIADVNLKESAMKHKSTILHSVQTKHKRLAFFIAF